MLIFLYSPTVTARHDHWVSVHSCHLLFDHFQFALIHGPDIPGSYAILEVFKQEMARVNVDILEISKLRWTGMGEFNSDDHYIYYCRQESLRRNGVAIMVNKRV